MSLNFGMPRVINFPFETNGKSIILGVLILMHITVTTNFHEVYLSSSLDEILKIIL